LERVAPTKTLCLGASYLLPKYLTSIAFIKFH